MVPLTLSDREIGEPNSLIGADVYQQDLFPLLDFTQVDSESAPRFVTEVTDH